MTSRLGGISPSDGAAIVQPLCAVCRGRGALQCAGCGSTWYCSVACQSAALNTHRGPCRAARVAWRRAEYVAGKDCLESGDVAGAREYFSNAAELGSGPGQSAFARLLLRDGDYAVARELLLESLKDSSVSTPDHPSPALYALGCLAARGAGTLLDARAALAYLKRAASLPGGETLAGEAILRAPSPSGPCGGDAQRRLDSRCQNYLAARARARAAGKEVGQKVTTVPLLQSVVGHCVLLPPLPAQPSTLGADDDLLRRYGIALQRPLSAKERALPQPLDPKLRVDLLRRPGGFVAAGGHYAAEREPRFRVCDQCGAAVPEASAWLCGLCSETYCSPKCQEGGGIPSACAHPPLSLRRSAPSLPSCSMAGARAGLPVRRAG